VENRLKTDKKELEVKKGNNFWKIPLDGIKIFDKKREIKSEDKVLKLIKDFDEMEVYQDWKNKNQDISFKEGMGLTMPRDFRELFEANEIVRNTFEKLPEHHKRQYILWIESSLNEDIRQERIERLVRIFSQRYNNF